MKAKISDLIVCMLASTVLSAALVSQAQAQTAAGTYKAPRNGFGQPDLSGTWSNETLTRMERQPQFGDRLIATPDDVAKLEGTRAAFVEAGVAPSNINSAASETIKPQCANAATAFAPGCGYNTAFSDTTLHLMRVNGEPRTSFITFPANGRIPRRADAKQRPDAYLAGNADNPENRGLPDRCIVSQNISTGALLNPTIYNNTYVFQQNKDTVVLVTEMSHDARTVRSTLNTTASRAGSATPSATGRARPWWWTPSTSTPNSSSTIRPPCT